jgi:hypothetical protein
VSHLSCCLVRPDVLPSAVSSAPFSASVRKLCSECKDVVADTFRKPDSHAARTPEVAWNESSALQKTDSQ